MPSSAPEIEKKHTYVQRIIENRPKKMRKMHLTLSQRVRRFSLWKTLSSIMAGKVMPTVGSVNAPTVEIRRSRNGMREATRTGREVEN